MYVDYSKGDYKHCVCGRRFLITDEERIIYEDLGKPLPTTCLRCRKITGEYKKIPELNKLYTEIICKENQIIAKENGDTRVYWFGQWIAWIGIFIAFYIAFSIMSLFVFHEPSAVIYNGTETVMHGPWTDYEDSFTYIYPSGSDPTPYWICSLVVGFVLTFFITPRFMRYSENVIGKLQVRSETKLRNAFVSYGPFLAFFANRIIFIVGAALFLVALGAPFWLLRMFVQIPV